MPDYRIMFDRNYLGHLDLGGRDVTLTITKVKGGELIAVGGRKSRKPIVHFSADIKPLICNKTNAKTIAAMYSNITEEWVGKRITLFTSMTRNPDGGGEVECIRVRPKVPANKTDTTLAQQPEPDEQIIASDEAPKAAPPPEQQPASGPPSGSPAAVAATDEHDALLIKAREFAECGLDRYAAWWKDTLTAEQRKRIGADRHATFKQIAEAVK